MRLPFLALCALAALVSPVRAETATIPLQHLTPSVLAGMLTEENQLLLPDGIESMTLELKKKAVTFSGTPESLEQVSVLLKLLDVPTRYVKITVEVVRGGKTVGKPSVRAANNKRISVRAPDLYAFELKPHINGDGTVAVLLETDSEKAMRRVPPGKAVPIPFKNSVVLVSATIEPPKLQ